MPWIKRNLFFVISAAIGLVLMAGAAYFLWSSLEAKSEAGAKFKEAVAELNNLQQKSPFPSEENIQAAKGDQLRVREFLSQARTLFSPFPTPPKVDEKSFRIYLTKTITQLQTDARSAHVEIPDQYAFSFSAIYSANNQRLVFPAESIQPWMVQLGEIKGICDILFQARINFLEGLRRVPVAKDDQGTIDYLGATSVTNEFGVTTPYEITFRGFSDEIAAVMAGFLRATNCYMIRNINVAPSLAPIATAASPQAALPAYIPQPAAPAPVRAIPPPEASEGFGGPAQSSAALAPRAAMPVYRASAGSTGPITIVAPRQLHVTMLVDVIKLKAPEQ